MCSRHADFEKSVLQCIKFDGLLSCALYMYNKLVLPCVFNDVLWSVMLHYALSDMHRKAPATVTVKIRGRTVAYATLWDERQLYHAAPSKWTGVWPGVLHNNNGGSGGFDGEYAVTTSSCPIVMMDEDQ